MISNCTEVAKSQNYKTLRCQTVSRNKLEEQDRANNRVCGSANRHAERDRKVQQVADGDPLGDSVEKKSSRTLA